jgi:hypothetical protein
MYSCSYGIYVIVIHNDTRLTKHQILRTVVWGSFIINIKDELFNIHDIRVQLGNVN